MIHDATAFAFVHESSDASGELKVDKAALIAKIEDCGKRIEAIFKAADDAKRPMTADELKQVSDIETEQQKAEVDLKTVEAADAARERSKGRVKVLSESPGRKTGADANEPLATVHTDEQGRVVGFFEDTDETVNLRFGESREAQRRRSYAEQNRENKRFLKSSGYKPCGAGGEFKSFADFVRTGLSEHTHSSFKDKVRKHYTAVQGMSEGIGSDGGYLVMPEFAGGIIDRVYSNDLWSRTDNYSVTGNNMTFLANAETSRATGSRHGGLRGYWLQGEGATLTKSKPTLREVTLKLAKLGVLVYLTQELIDDGGSALQSYVARKAAEEFNFMIGDSLINGTGVGQPLGVLNSPSLVSIAKETGQQATTLVTENIEKMYARFYAPNIGGLRWYHNQDILPQLNLMTLGVGTGGVTTYMPPGGLSAAPFGSIKGAPIQPIEFCSTLGTQGDLIAADLGQVLSISKGGIAQAVSMHVEFLTDQMALRFIMRLNAGPWENAPLTPYKGASNTQSSFVTLDTRA